MKRIALIQINNVGYINADYIVSFHEYTHDWNTGQRAVSIYMLNREEPYDFIGTIEEFMELLKSGKDIV